MTLLLSEDRPGVRLLTMNRPAARNALSTALVEAHLLESSHGGRGHFGDLAGQVQSPDQQVAVEISAAAGLDTADLAARQKEVAERNKSQFGS